MHIILDIKKENIEKIFEKFKGKQEQIPPIYSAIKVNGKKLYEYARKGQEVEIKPRKIEIYNIELLNIKEKQKQIEFQVSCSKGTYIRSLCEDIAQRLETVGYMLELKRIQVGNFNIKDAITIEQLENNIDNKEFIEENFIQFEEIFKNKECLRHVTSWYFSSSPFPTIRCARSVVRCFRHFLFCLLLP